MRVRVCSCLTHRAKAIEVTKPLLLSFRYNVAFKYKLEKHSQRPSIQNVSAKKLLGNMTNKDIKNVSFNSTFVRRANTEAEVEQNFLEIVENRSY